MNVCQFLDVLLATLFPSVLLGRTVGRLFRSFSRGYLVTH